MDTTLQDTGNVNDEVREVSFIDLVSRLEYHLSTISDLRCKDQLGRVAPHIKQMLVDLLEFGEAHVPAEQLADVRTAAQQVHRTIHAFQKSQEHQSVIPQFLRSRSANGLEIYQQIGQQFAELLTQVAGGFQATLESPASRELVEQLLESLRGDLGGQW